MPFKLQINYFAILREQRGVASETLQTASATALALYEELRARHGFSLPPERLRVAVDDEFADWNVALQEGQRITFIPPVAGG